MGKKGKIGWNERKETWNKEEREKGRPPPTKSKYETEVVKIKTQWEDKGTESKRIGILEYSGR